MQNVETKVNNISKYLIKNKSLIVWSFASVFVLGFIAHGYCFTNLNIGHDSLYEIFFKFNYPISIGRFSIPIYVMLTHLGICSPWLSGIWALIWLSFSTYLILRLFKMTNKLFVVFVAGMLVLNPSVISNTATYIHDFDIYMFAAFLSIAAAFLWNKNSRWSWFSIVLLIVSLSLYQSMISCYLTLVALVTIIKLLKGKESKTTVLNLLKAVMFFIIACVFYLLISEALCLLFDINKVNAVHSLFRIWDFNVTQILDYFIQTYFKWAQRMVCSLMLPSVIVLVVDIVLFLACVWMIIKVIKRNKIKASSVIFVFILLAFLPFLMNVSCFINSGFCKDLMTYASWFSYLLLVLLLKLYCNTKNVYINQKQIWLKIASFSLLCFLAFVCVLTSNAAYVKKDLDYQATYSIMTEVCTKIDSEDGYVAGKTPVAFIGPLNTQTPDIFKELDSSINAVNIKPIDTELYYKGYFETILQRNINVYEAAKTNKLKEIQEIKNMPSFPNQGYIKWHDGILVVKLS